MYLLLLLQLLVEGVGFALGRVEFLLRRLQLLLPLRLGVLHLVLQDFVLLLRSFLHLLGDAQSLLALLWLSKHTVKSANHKSKNFYLYFSFLTDGFAESLQLLLLLVEGALLQLGLQDLLLLRLQLVLLLQLTVPGRWRRRGEEM